MIGLRINEIEVTPLRRRPTFRFLKGPIDWTSLCMAARLPGQALAVYLAVHHRVALTGNASVTLPKNLLAELGVSRDAKARALHALEEASLVAVERRRGQTARVALGTSTSAEKGK
jgi:DNA-binding transcriptional ArsR family regulator